LKSSFAVTDGDKQITDRVIRHFCHRPVREGQGIVALGRLETKPMLVADESLAKQ